MTEEEKEAIADFCASVGTRKQIAYGVGSLTPERVGKNRGLPHASQKEASLDKRQTSGGNSPLSARQEARSAEDEGRNGTQKMATAGRSGTRMDRKAVEGRGRVLVMAKDIVGERISDLIDQGKMREARTILLRELRKVPCDHWLLDRLSETYYEEGRMPQAIKAIKKAYALNPKCPMVLWDYANTLEEVWQPTQAIALYNKILGRSIQEIADEECGEGLPWAKSLYADSAYRAALCYQQLGNFTEAWLYILRHFFLRDQGAQSIYPEEEVRRSLSKLSRPITSSAHGPTSPSTVFWPQVQVTQT